MSRGTISIIVLVKSWRLKLGWQHQIRDQTDLIGVHHPIHIRPFHGLQAFFDELKLPLSLIIFQIVLMILFGLSLVRFIGSTVFALEFCPTSFIRVGGGV